ncbi:unnamed protein product, partial [Effrenium voratum]
RAGVVSCNSAISACGAWQRAVALLRRGPRNIISYNATMALCDWMCTLSWLSQSQQDTLQPSNISVNTAVNAAGKAGRWQHALFALQELATPTVRSLGCAVTACETVRCWTWALQLLTGAPAAPNSVVFGAGISACRGQLVRAMQLLSEAERSLAQLDVIVFNAAISACETAGAWQEALGLLARLSLRRLRKSVISFNGCLSACVRCAQWRFCLELLQAMARQDVPPNAISFNATITACEKTGEWQQALHLLSQLGTPDIVSFSAAISACGAGRSWRHALALLRGANARRLAELVACNSALSACAAVGAWRQGLQLLSSSVAPDLITYNAAMQAVGLPWRVALQALRQSQELMPNVLSYGAAIDACERTMV